MVVAIHSNLWFLMGHRSDGPLTLAQESESLQRALTVPESYLLSLVSTGHILRLCVCLFFAVILFCVVLTQWLRTGSCFRVLQ